MFDAQTAIAAGQQQDPLFEQLVERLMVRCALFQESK